MTGGLPRRSFLSGLVGAGVAGPLAAMAAAPIAAEAATRASEAQNAAGGASAADPAARIPFEGINQQGILPPPQRAAAFVSFDVTAATRGELAELLQTITTRARFLTTGGAPQTTGISAPPADSGVLGPEVAPDNLAVTVAVGASLFDARFGLAALKPSQLRTMEDFENDALRREVCDGDLLLQITAQSTDTVLHAVRDIARATRGSMQIRWRRDGFVSAPRPSGTPRNLMGFKDGTSNPDITDAALMQKLVWASDGEPAWAAGGSYQVVRVIRMLVEFWDRVNIHEQENMIGRRRDSGAPLTAVAEFDDPHYDLDPTGESVPLNAHIRLANSRSQADLDTRILRRAYNYDGGVDPNGNLDMGLVFVAFNRDLDNQFVAIQKRLANEPLVDYISPFGGGYFFALPGVQGARDWLGQGLLSA
ncbi:iron uptake transporter deferrochelatase/peroxidase subunit [Subtercola lobariae]|uniref:Deferrochelatase n=1 Tax=Subtercola lobariae TaxID=1588641 RepID=A0A917BDP8_9MICO|nr:iron uptake transporter deferrochelatase/peroxidase subunit [Subtercola lobariae]GGF36650.1 iron-dependent peroxidase [Subtercola lobariae]